MKLLMNLLRDALLLSVLVIGMLFAVSGVVLPYRSVFVQAGAYQLEAFETGLAFYHYGLNGPQVFYRLSPLNDFVTTKQASRSAHLSQANLQQDNYTAKWQETDKLQAILETLKQFAGTATPWYEVESEAIKVRYETSRDGQDWLISKTVIFATPTYVQKTGMSLTYFRNDLVSDGVTAVSITNFDRPGSLTVFAGDGQQIILNRSYNLLEVVESVEREVTELTQTIRVRAHDGRQQ